MVFILFMTGKSWINYTRLFEYRLILQVDTMLVYSPIFDVNFSIIKFDLYQRRIKLL